MQSSGEEQQRDERDKEREGGRWKEEVREVEGGRRWKEDAVQDGSRWRGEEGGDGLRQQWKEDAVIRRGQVVAGARAKGEGGRRGGVSLSLTLDGIFIHMYLGSDLWPWVHFVTNCIYKSQSIAMAQQMDPTNLATNVCCIIKKKNIESASISQIVHR